MLILVFLTGDKSATWVEFNTWISFFFFLNSKGIIDLALQLDPFEHVNCSTFLANAKCVLTHRIFY